jgi:cytochrome c nitrite reductase small subunit
MSCHKTVPHGKGFKDDSFNEAPKSGELLKNKGGF